MKHHHHRACPWNWPKVPVKIRLHTTTKGYVSPSENPQTLTVLSLSLSPTQLSQSFMAFSLYETIYVGVYENTWGGYEVWKETISWTLLSLTQPTLTVSHVALSSSLGSPRHSPSLSIRNSGCVCMKIFVGMLWYVRNNFWAASLSLGDSGQSFNQSKFLTNYRR